MTEKSVEKELLEEISKSSAFERILSGAGVLAGIVGMIIIREINPTSSGLFPQCPLYAMTGFHCPGCGLTRGCHALFNGDILSALDYNLLLPVYLFFGGYVLTSLFLTAFRGFGLKFKIFPQSVIWSFAIIALLFFILRNIPVYPLNLLAP